MRKDSLIRQLGDAMPNYDQFFRFSVRVEIPKTNPNRKTGNFLSLSEVCELIDIKPTTYRRYEGSLFPRAKRLGNNYRIFTKEEVDVLRKIWNERKKCNS
jgi:predicted DNA-binding transcriptional regulator AlpA